MRGILVYLEYQSICPIVRIGSPHPLTRKRACLPLGPEGGGEQHSLAAKGVGGLNSDDWIESLALCILCAVVLIVNTLYIIR